jgi:hypothetical protein
MVCFSRLDSAFVRQTSVHLQITPLGNVYCNSQGFLSKLCLILLDRWLGRSEIATSNNTFRQSQSGWRRHGRHKWPSGPNKGGRASWTTMKTGPIYDFVGVLCVPSPCFLYYIRYLLCLGCFLKLAQSSREVSGSSYAGLLLLCCVC